MVEYTAQCPKLNNYGKISNEQQRQAGMLYTLNDCYISLGSKLVPFALVTNYILYTDTLLSLLLCYIPITLTV